MIHISVSLYRKDGLTKEQFDDHWANTHASIFMGNPVARSNLIKYSQQHVDPQANQKLASMGVKTSLADGIVQFYAETLDRLLAVFDSDYYKNVVVPDECNFIARGREEMSVGVDDDKWVEGKAGARVDSSEW